MARPKSKKPKKQRKYEKTAPLHARRKMLAAHLSAELKKQYGRRGFPVRKGDEVVIMRGKFNKRSGKILRVSYKKYKVYIEGIMVKKTDGTERQAPIHPSNLKITKLNLDDKRRIIALKKERKQKDVKKTVNKLVKRK